MIRILIAHDHSIMCEGLRRILSKEPDMSVGGCVHDARDLLIRIREAAYNLVVLGYMLEIGGLDTLKELKYEHPKLPVLVLSIQPEKQAAMRALKMGAAGYLTNESPPEELVKAIRKIISGERYVDPTLAGQLARTALGGVNRPLHEALSDREYQTLCLMASGRSITDIAHELSLSVKTISTYRARILEKMQMKCIAELIAYAVRNRLA